MKKISTEDLKILSELMKNAPITWACTTLFYVIIEKYNKDPYDFDTQVEVIKQVWEYDERTS